MTLMSPDDMREVVNQAPEVLLDLADIYRAASLPQGRGKLTPGQGVVVYPQVPCRLVQAKRMALERLTGAAAPWTPIKSLS